MIIVYASDNNFAKILGVSIISLFENNKNAMELSVFILDDGINEENKIKLNQIAERYNRTIRYISDFNVDDLASVELNALTWSKAAFARLAIGRLLQEYDFNKVIYLDCDTIICDSLEGMWNFDMKGYVACAVIDPVSKYHKKNINVPSEYPYFNSGVMLIDLSIWRKDNIENEIIDVIKKFNGKIPYVDQGIINATLYKRIKVLPVEFNMSTVYYDYSFDEILHLRKPMGTHYCEQEILKAQKNPIIIHYTKSIFDARPWFENSKHKEKDRWLFYYSDSPWYGEKMTTYKLGGVKRIWNKVNCFIPRKLSISINGFLHSYVKPFLERH